MEPSVLALKPGQLAAKDKALLRKAGVVVIEVEDPASVRFLRPNADLSSTEMLKVAMRAIKKSGSFISAESALGEALVEAILAKPALDAALTSHTDTPKET